MRASGGLCRQVLLGAAVGDKGYDSKANRAAARNGAHVPGDPVQVIGPGPAGFLPESALGSRPDRTPRRQAQALQAHCAPCANTSKNFGSFVAFALGLIIVKSVHTA